MMSSRSDVAEKSCKDCGVSQPLSEFYKSKVMSDGYLNSCKTCKKSYQTRLNAKKSQDPEYIESQRERGRDKYYRLYRGKSSGNNKAKREYIKRNPEKKKAHLAVQRIKVPTGLHKHHWSYNAEHRTDVVIIMEDLHNKLHRFMEYDSDSKFYKAKTTGVLLDTIHKHLDFIEKVKSI